MTYVGTWAERTPDVVAVADVTTGAQLTYAELDARSNQVARHLRRRGLGAGDAIALLMGNSPEFLVIAWAAQRAGLRYTPVNWHLTADEMRYIVEDCGAKALIGDPHLLEVAASSTAPRFVVGGDLPGTTRLEDAILGEPTTPLPDETEGSDMIYSSGTTGRPKGGRRALSGIDPRTGHRKLTQVFTDYGIEAGSVYLSPGAPLYHAAPLRWSIGAQRLGATVALMDRFEPRRALEAIATHRVTHSQWVPTMFVRLLDLPEADRHAHDLSSHRVALHTAAPCPPAIKRAMLEWWGPIIHEYYGASEGGLMTRIGPEEWLEHPGSVGKPVFGIVHIVDEHGNELPAGQVGGIYTERGVPIEYHNDDSKTRSIHDDRGWSTVGDIGWVDDDGYLYLADRRDDLIIRGGVNIYPKEIEDVLITHPAVADVAVFGIPDPVHGHEVKAVVELHDHTEASEELEAALIAHCSGSLARFKRPASIDFEVELPRASSGKLYKRRLRDRYLDGA